MGIWFNLGKNLIWTDLIHFLERKTVILFVVTMSGRNEAVNVVQCT